LAAVVDIVKHSAEKTVDPLLGLFDLLHCLGLIFHFSSLDGGYEIFGCSKLQLDLRQVTLIQLELLCKFMIFLDDQVNVVEHLAVAM